MAAVVPDLVSGPIVELSAHTGGGAAWGATVAELRTIAVGDLSTPMRRSACAGAVEVGLTVDLDLFYWMLDEFLAGVHEMRRYRRDLELSMVSPGLAAQLRQ
jgi:hypothetical protein